MEGEDPVRPLQIRPGMTVGELVGAMGQAGAYNGGALSRAVDVYEQMLRDRESVRFFGLAGAMVPAGMGQIVSDLMEQDHIDVLVCTGATCVHDIIEAIGCHHYRGTSRCSDTALREQGINRIYDVFLPNEAFEHFEGYVQEVLESIPGHTTLSIADLLRLFGETLDTGILATAARKQIPVFAPAFQDSMLGLQCWLHTQTHHLVIDACRDMKDLLDRCFTAPRSGALLVGGGVPKNYILQGMLLTPNGFEYAVQLTGDRPDLGGLSGATLDEARSWGKLTPAARSVTVYGDATITLPLLVAATLERMAA